METAIKIPTEPVTPELLPDDDSHLQNFTEEQKRIIRNLAAVFVSNILRENSKS